MKLVKESISSEFKSKYFKGKSKEDIEKSLDELYLKERFKSGIQNNIIWLVQDAIDKGVDPSMDDNKAITYSVDNDYNEIAKLLLKDPRVAPNLDLLTTAYLRTNIELLKILIDNENIFKNIDPKEAEEMKKQIKEKIIKNK